MVFHCNLHWVWLDLVQNPQKSIKISEIFRKINLSRPSEGVGSRAWTFLSATLHGESISDGFGAIRSDPDLENLRKTFQTTKSPDFGHSQVSDYPGPHCRPIGGSILGHLLRFPKMIIHFASPDLT